MGYLGSLGVTLYVLEQSSRSMLGMMGKHTPGLAGELSLLLGQGRLEEGKKKIDRNSE